MNFTNNEQILVAEPLAVNTWAEGRKIFVELADNRVISFPANRFKILKDANEIGRAHV